MSTNWRSTSNPKTSREGKENWWHAEEKRITAKRCQRLTMKGKRRHRKARENPACWLK